ncbi:MAG TPA: hypothetical protein VJ672_15695 [Gemmatimonadaceae bacterium]|nr:hypothetical protein [Gemmatimonadaceae bacterium]
MTRLTSRRIQAATALCAVVAWPALAQSRDATPNASVRTITAARQLRDGDSLRVRVYHSAGPLDVRAASTPLLYNVSVRYEPAFSTFVRRFDSTSRTLVVGVDSASAGFHLRFWREVPEKAKEHPSSLTLALGRGVPLDLRLDFGASAATVDLTDLSVERLVMRFGASETKLFFGTANPLRMQELRIQCSAGTLTARQLGNANAPRVEIEGVAAGLDLDLSGAWSHDMEINADVVMGGLSLHVPDDVGVRVVTQRELLAEVETPGFVTRDGARYSANWDSAPRKLTVNAKALMGGVSLKQ